MAAQTGARIRRGEDHSQPAEPLRHFIAHLVRAAVAATSIGGSQPWRFSYRGADRTIELRADPEKALSCGDPHGRDVHIGCGAALFNLRLAAAWLGREPVAALLPRPDDPLLLATLRLGGAHRPRIRERELYAAITRRHAGREGFANRPVPGTVLAELAGAARTEGAMLHVLQPGEAREPRIAVAREPRIALLSTRFRARADWLRAGQALQRVLLLATVRGVSAQPVGRPPEFPDAWQVPNPRAGTEQPHVILRLGYASCT